ncbi:unnamed protein product [Lepidochelys kempii]
MAKRSTSAAQGAQPKVASAQSPRNPRGDPLYRRPLAGLLRVSGQFSGGGGGVSVSPRHRRAPRKQQSPQHLAGGGARLWPRAPGSWTPSPAFGALGRSSARASQQRPRSPPPACGGRRAPANPPPTRVCSAAWGQRAGPERRSRTGTVFLKCL